MTQIAENDQSFLTGRVLLTGLANIKTIPFSG
jgi:hypothetical protein